MAVQEVFADALQVCKGDLPAKSLICHHQKGEALLAQEIEGVLVTRDGQAVLACRLNSW
jgi:hypothetical protein